MNSNDPYNIDDSSLVKAISKSNEDAFEKLYYRYYDQLYRFAFYRLNSDENAKDALSVLFLKIWEKRRWLNPNKSIKAYLYKGLNNWIIDYYKSPKSRSSSIEDYKHIPVNDDNLDTQIDLKSVLAKMPNKLQIVFTLSRYENYKYSEIAEICGISVKAVEKRMSKALSYLRKKLS